MKQRDLKAQMERDKLHAARHEAGHLTIAMAQAVAFPRAYVFPTNTDDPMHNQTWGGNCLIDGHITEQIAVAGLVAEAWSEDNDVDPYIMAEQIEFEADTISASDRKSFPDWPILEATITEVISLLVKHRRFFDWAVAELVQHEVITDGQAREAFE